MRSTRGHPAPAFTRSIMVSHWSAHIEQQKNSVVPWTSCHQSPHVDPQSGQPSGGGSVVVPPLEPSAQVVVEQVQGAKERALDLLDPAELAREALHESEGLVGVTDVGLVPLAEERLRLVG